MIKYSKGIEERETDILKKNTTKFYILQISYITQNTLSKENNNNNKQTPIAWQDDLYNVYFLLYLNK